MLEFFWRNLFFTKFVCLCNVYVSFCNANFLHFQLIFCYIPSAYAFSIYEFEIFPSWIFSNFIFWLTTTKIKKHNDRQKWKRRETHVYWMRLSEINTVGRKISTHKMKSKRSSNSSGSIEKWSTYLTGQFAYFHECIEAKSSFSQWLILKLLSKNDKTRFGTSDSNKRERKLKLPRVASNDFDTWLSNASQRCIQKIG